MSTMISDDDRSWAINAHAAGLLTMTNIPFASVFATLYVWLRVRIDPSKVYARAHAADAFNFQATFTLVVLLLATAYIAMLTTVPSHPVASYLPVAVGVYGVLIAANIVATIAGTIAASDKRAFHYPLAIAFIH